MPRFRIDRLSRSHGIVRALDGVSIDVAEGEHLAVVGPSGSGKTTLLRLLAGLDAPDSGAVWIDGRDATLDPPEARGLGMVFQSPALLPHRTVAGNLAIALELRRVPTAEHAPRIRAMATQLGLLEKLGRRPAELSGGEAQRVSIGRALVAGARLLLLDEPFSGLDAPLRREFRSLLRELRVRHGLTLVHVTHDQHEALVLGDRVALLDGGRLVQCGSPRELVECPATVFAAGFFGDPAVNWIDGTVRADAGRRFFVPDNGATAWALDRPWTIGRRVRLGIRPEHARWRPSRSGSRPGWTGIARRLEFDVPRGWIVADVEGTEWRVAWDGPGTPEPGTRGEIGFEPASALGFDPESGRRIEPD
ncbi:MAG: ABC transporter ATP-binding protein [Verrucomicrobia bacterium]|nr:MAG: ABC transporter ATP-binding protein [Verrucomicrobiota bacterium]